MKEIESGLLNEPLPANPGPVEFAFAQIATHLLGRSPKGARGFLNGEMDWCGHCSSSGSSGKAERRLVPAVIIVADAVRVKVAYADWRMNRHATEREGQNR